jgi:glucan phosphoethanolaminetransferase (alkaline phosphatase superfamily)
VQLLAVLMETNTDEVAGYAGSQQWLLVAIYLSWIAVLLGALYLFLRKPRVVWRHRSRWWWLVASGLMAFVLVLGEFTPGEEELGLVTTEASCTGARGCSYPSLIEEMFESYPVGMPFRVTSYVRQADLLKNYGEELKGVRLNLPRDSALADLDETFVIVIGESSRAANWSLGGYERETNPLLSLRENLVWFDDAVSMAANTRVAVPLLLTHTSIYDLAADKFKPSWINAFKEAGFTTYWFSIQNPVGNHDTSIGIYASLVDDKRFLNLGTYRSHGAHDDALLGALYEALDAKVKKKLIVLHTLGSHAPYQRRYPVEFDHFKPALAQDSDIGVFDREHKEEIRNSYDNSIRYTDHFLNEVIGALDRQATISALWFVSDHGQTLADDGCKNVGHGFRSRNNFHVPMLFWYSQQYAAHFPENTRLEHRHLAPVYTLDFYASVLGSAGFKLPDDLADRQMLSPTYSVGTRLITVDGINRTDFDKEFPIGHFCPRER